MENGVHVRRFLLLALLVSFSAIQASANLSVFFSGAFYQDNQVELFSFNADGSTGVVIQSYGYAGGAFGSQTIAAGGFAPDAFLFDSTGAEIGSDSGGHCGVTGTDSVTGNCDDPYISQPYLAAGVYTLALVVYGNQPNDSLLADGFVQNGSPGFTCAGFGVAGSFCDGTSAFGTPRTGDWALSINGVTEASDITAATPEPKFNLTLLLGMVVGALVLRRRSHQRGFRS